jgi:hypothetical protein
MPDRNVAARLAEVNFATGPFRDPDDAFDALTLLLNLIGSY